MPMAPAGWLAPLTCFSGLAGQVEPVEVHDLVPGRDEVSDELLLGVIAGVDLGDGPQLGIRAEDQVGTGTGPPDPAGRVPALERARVLRRRLPRRAHVEQVDEE